MHGKIDEEVIASEIGTTEKNRPESLSTAKFKQLKGFSCLIPIPLSNVLGIHKVD